MTLAINISQQQRHPRPAAILSEKETVSIRSNNTSYDIMSPISTESDHEEEEEDDEDEDDDDIILGGEDGSSSMSSSPSIPDENINFDLVYALHTFTATVEGQASVFKGDALILMEDTNIYWWLVEVLKTQEIGYIPAENIETPYERLARLNKHRNVDITTPFPEDNLSAEYTIFSNVAKKVTMADDDCLENVTFFEVESDLEQDEDDQSDNSIGNDGDDGDDCDGCNDGNDKAYYEDEEYDGDEFSIVHEDNDNEFLPDMEQCMVLGDSNPSDVLPSAAANEQQQKKPRSSQQRRPQRYLTPAHFKSDTSHYLPSDGSSFKRHSAETHNIRVFAGNIGQGPLFHSFSILATTTTDHLLKDVVQRFDLAEMETGPEHQNSIVEYYITVQGTDGDEYILAPQDKPCSIFKTLTASLTTPMPTVSQNICRKPQEGNGMAERKRSSNFGNHEQTSYEEDSVIRFYIHRRIKHAHNERQGVVYIKVSLYPDEYISPASSSTFFNSNSNKKKTISTTTTATIKTEIDRIDKILTVSYDTLVGSVTSTALEKFHIPDTESVKDSNQASPLFDTQLRQQSQKTSTAAKYAMSIRNGNGQETKLSATDCIADILHEQRQLSPRSNSNDYFFILRRCQKPAKQTLSSASFGFSSLSKKSRKVSQAASIGSSIGNMITGGGGGGGGNPSGTRRPSILDILMDYSPPPSANDRQLNSNNNNNKGDQQGLGMTSSQERSPYCLDLAINGDHVKQSTTINDNNKKQYQNQLYNKAITSDNSSKKRREGSSSSSPTTFKQQLKRLVTWGSPSSFKLKKVHDLTISTSVSSTSSFKSSKSSTHSQQQQQLALPASTTFASELEKGGAVDAKRTPTMVTRVAVKSQYLRQQQHESADRRPRRQDVPPSPKTNMESIVSEASLSTTASSYANSSSGSTSKHSSPTIYHQINDASSSSTSSDDDDDDEDIDDDDDDEPTTLDDTAVHTATSMVEGMKVYDEQHNVVNRGQSMMTIGGEVEDNIIHPIDNNTSTSDTNDIATIKAQQDEFIDSDLFYLVTQGVDFLKTREGTKWEEDNEGNGYQYHPWNWSSQSRTDSPETITTTPHQGLDNENSQETLSPLSSPAAAAVVAPISIMDKSLASPPLSPAATITQLKGLHITNQEGKSRISLPSVMTPKESPVDDEELQWIVNSHILF